MHTTYLMGIVALSFLRRPQTSCLLIQIKRSDELLTDRLNFQNLARCVNELMFFKKMHPKLYRYCSMVGHWVLPPTEN
jgi:hypothetical protein